jgi:hypothetical protein
MVAGKSYQDALTAAGISKAARLRRDPCPPHVRDAAEFLVRRTAEACGASREWILCQLVHCYRAASIESTFTDSRGLSRTRPADWSAAIRALELLGNQAGMFGKRTIHDVPDDLRELMRQVGQRGRPGIEHQAQTARAAGALEAPPGARVLDAA